MQRADIEAKEICFNNFPTEIKEHIISFLRPKRLSLFSQTNKQHAAIALPLLKDLHKKLADQIFFSAGHYVTYFYTGNVVYVCGINSDGQLGLGDYIDRNIFTKVKLDTDIGEIRQVIGNGQSSFILATTGLYACGNNDYGQLGLGDHIKINRFSKVELPVSNTNEIDYLIAGEECTLLYTKDKKFFASGGYYTELCKDFMNHSRVFKEVPSHSPLREVIELTPDGRNTGQFFAKCTDNTLYSSMALPFLSQDIEDELYIDDFEMSHDFHIIKRVHHNYFKLDFTDNGLHATGVNIYGQLGVGDNNNHNHEFIRVRNLPAELQKFYQTYYQLNTFIKNLEHCLNFISPLEVRTLTEGNLQLKKSIVSAS